MEMLADDKRRPATAIFHWSTMSRIHANHEVGEYFFFLMSFQSLWGLQSLCEA